MRAILIGLRASGKSTIGRLVAQRLGVSFVDLDDMTAAYLNSPSAGDAIRTHGLETFRKGEVVSLRSALDDDSVGILALGGGTPTDPDAASLLRHARTPIIYLRASVGSLQTRLGATDLASRPTLTGVGPIEEVGPLVAQRDPVYRALAQAHGTVIEVDDTTEDEVVTLVLAAIAE